MKTSELASGFQIQERNQEHYLLLAEKLEKMQKEINNGRGLNHINYIISDLKRGDIRSAKADCFNQSDKYGSIPEIKELIKKELFSSGEKHPWSLFEK